MLENYPKKRLELPAAYARIHESHYKMNRTGGSPATSLSLWMEGWLHRKVAHDVVGTDVAKTTLEIGAGTLNQLEFEPMVGPYDIVEPFKDLYEGAAARSRLRAIYADIRDIPLEPAYDRITSVATFEHICDLPEVVARAGLLLLPGGSFRNSIPSEGTPLWKLGWKLTTGIEFRIKYGLDYGTFLKYEHVNTARDIESVLTHFFERIDCQVFGLSRALSLYQFFECQNPRLGRCLEYLRRTGG